MSKTGQITYDVAVIGGGITGASAANHLAAAGFLTILLERGDFAGGTSGRSSRLQHCGLTYFSPGRSLWNFLGRPALAIEHAELARRAMRDRSRFVRETPQRVRPIRFHVPLYRDGSIPVWKVKLGFKALEGMDRGGVPLELEILDAAAARVHPALQHLRDLDRLLGVIRFTEYQFDWPERICLDAALNAGDLGAELRNYTAAASLARARDGTWTIETRSSGGAESTVRAKAVLNAAGAWVDEIPANAGLGLPRLNQGLKGTNVVVRLPVEFRGLAFETVMRSGDPFYVIPWRDLHYFGPKDKPHDPTEAGFRAGEDEIAALVEAFNDLFPRLRISRRDVLYSWAGVRPRTARAGYPDGCEAVLLHDLAKAGAPGYYAYTGGLIMTHRHAGRSITAAIARRLRPSRAAQAVSYAARLPPAGPADSPAVQSDGERVSLVALRHAATHEKAATLADLMFRRTSLGWSERLGSDAAHDVASAVRDLMGWSAAEAVGHADRYVAEVGREFGLTR